MMEGEGAMENLLPCARQCFDPTRVACCYFERRECSPIGDAEVDHQVQGQGILVQLCESSHQEGHVPSLAVITSHQLLPSVSSARQWLIGFNSRGAQRKEFPLADYIDQKQLELITCCGEQHSLWSNRQEHVESKCSMHSDYTVLLLGDSFSRDILTEFGEALHVFSVSDCMDLRSAQEVLLGGQMVTVYYRTRETVYHSSLQIQAPPRVGSSYLLSTQVDWYHNHYSTFLYKPAAMLPVTGAPVIYCETNTGKSWLLGMHICLASQSVQYGVSFSHILELLQCHLNQEHPIHTFPPHLSSHLSKLSLLDQAVQSNLCTPRHYDNITSFFDTFGCCELLQLTDLLQIIHCITRKHLLFAQSCSIYDDVEIRRASLRLVEALSKLFKQFDTPLITATVDSVRQWCPSLTIDNLREAFKDLCAELAFSIIPNQNDDTMAAVWFSSWSNLLCLNGLVTSPIFQLDLFSTFHGCQAVHPSNASVQQCFGQIMAACLMTQFHRVTVIEKQLTDQQHHREQESKDTKQQVSELSEQVKKLQMEKIQPIAAQHSELSPEKLFDQVRELERVIGRQQEQIAKLQEELAVSERNKQVMQGLLRERYPLPQEAQLRESFVKKQLDSSYKDYDLYKSTGDQKDVTQHQFSTERDYHSTNVRRQSEGQEQMRTRRVSSLPGSTPARPPSLPIQRRSYSVSATLEQLNHTNNGISSYTPSLDTIESPPEYHTGQSYAHQQSVTSSVSSEGGSVYATPVGTTPEVEHRVLGYDSTDTGAFAEQVYEQVVRTHFQKFIKNTNFETISSHLYQNKLISPTDYENLSKSSDKGNFFYIRILTQKGTGAYTILRRCIAEETDHRGHVDLNQLFKEAEQRVGIRTSFEQ